MSEASNPRIVYLTAGAGGMFCGSCMHDNALAKALIKQGLDVQLVPTYTPIRTDELNISVDQVFFGGINIFLQQKIPMLRRVPSFLDRILDNPRLIRKVTSGSVDLSSESLGALAASMLMGIKGNQRKEVRRLCNWLVQTAKPDLIVFTNALVGGCIPEIKRTTDASVLVTLQGDDVFLDSLPDRYRRKCIDQISHISNDVDGFITHTEFYRNYMSEYFSISKNKIHVTPLGLDLGAFKSIENQSPDDVTTIGYLARLAPEKGFHRLIDAFIELKRRPGTENVRVSVAGWLGKQNEDFAQQNFDKIKAANLSGDFQYIGQVDLQQKVEFLSRIDIFSVPAEFLEPKGLYVLEALASGIPVVQPAHGSFPELIGSTDGGLLCLPNDHDDLVEKIMELVADRKLRHRLGQQGRASVIERRNSETMAAETEKVIRKVLGPN